MLHQDGKSPQTPKAMKFRKEREGREGGGGGIQSGLIKDYNYVGTAQISPEAALRCSSPIIVPSAPLHIGTKTTGK